MRQSPKTIGVLDDEPEMRKALRRLLGSQGYEVTEFASGKKFIDSLGKHHLDCLLLDLHMPDINGFDVLEMLHSQSNPMAVIVITAHDTQETAEQVRALGAIAYLRKPVDKDELFAMIDLVKHAR